MQGTVYSGVGAAVPPIEAALLLCCLALLSATATRRVTFPLLSLARTSVAIIFVQSWIFVFCSAFIVLGLGTSWNEATCRAALWLCITAYAFAKLATMFFLVERAHVVLGGGLPRRDSKIYRLNLLIFVVWAGIFVAISVSHRSTLNPLMQSSCEFEIGTYAIATAMGMDVLSNTYLMLLFVVPLLRTRISSAALRSLAKKSIVAAAVSTLSSAANMTLMAWKHGGESSWLCMLLCSLDVTICSTAIFFVTTSCDESRLLTPSARLETQESFKALSDRMIASRGSFNWGVDAGKEGTPSPYFEDDPVFWRGDASEVLRGAAVLRGKTGYCTPRLC